MRIASLPRVTLAAAGAVGATAIAFWQLRIVGPVTLPQEVAAWNGDLFNIYYPSFAFAYRGEQFLPRWNPWQMAGTPFLAGYNGGFLYPPNWLATLVPVHLALGWLCAAHLAFAGVTTLAAARTLRLSWPAACVAALILMLNTRLASEAAWPSYLAAHTWVPAVGLAAGLFAREPGFWRGALLGSTLALQFLTGIAQHACYEAYLLPLAGMVAWLVRPRFDGAWIRRFAVGLATATVAAVGLTAVQLLPTAELLATAGRSGGMTLAQAGLPESALAELRAVGANAGPVLGLFVLGVGAARRRWVAGAAVVAAAAVLVGIGSPLFVWAFHTLPGVALFRLPHRIVPMATFPLALVAGAGLDLAWRRRGSCGSRAARALAVAAVLALGAPALATSTHAWPGALVLAGLVAVLLAPGRRARHAAAWAVVAFVAVERFANTRNTVMLTQHAAASYFAPPWFADVLRREGGHDRAIVIKDWKRRFPHMEKAGELWRIHVAQDYAPLVAGDYQALYQPLAHTVPGQFFSGRTQPSPQEAGWRMLDLLAVRWIVVPPTVRWGPLTDRFRPAHAGPGGTIYENLRAMPRAYLARGVRRVDDRAAALRAVQAAGFDPRAEVVLEVAPPETAAPPAGAVTVVAETNDEVVLRAASTTGGIVVLTDLYWPGWRATVGGAPVDILRANYLLRAVVVPPGTHDVRFRYEPTRVWTGALVTLTTLGLLAVLSFRRSAAARRR